MSKRIKRVITISIIAIVVIIAIISTFFIVRYFENKSKIDNVTEVYSEDKVQDRLDNENNTMRDDLLLQIDGETVLGVIKIEKIGFEGLIYEGTTLDTLDKGVGHFENSSYFDGNVALAAHNSNEF